MERRLLLVTLAVLAATVLLEAFFVDLGHAYLPWHKVPGFDIIFGFAGCTAIIIASKALGKHFLQRPEHYYEQKR